MDAAFYFDAVILPAASQREIDTLFPVPSYYIHGVSSVVAPMIGGSGFLRRHE